MIGSELLNLSDRLLNASTDSEVLYIMAELDKLCNEKVFENCLTGQNNLYHKYDVKNHTVKAVLGCERDALTRWAALFHDTGKPVVKTTGTDGRDHFYKHSTESALLTNRYLRKLDMTEYDRDYIVSLVLHHEDLNFLSIEEVTVNKIVPLFIKNAEEWVYKLLYLRKADILAQSDYSIDRVLPIYNRVADLVDYVANNKLYITFSDLDITEKDLYNLGVTDRNMRRIKEILMNCVWKQSSCNRRQSLISIAKSEMKNIK